MAKNTLLGMFILSALSAVSVKSEGEGTFSISL